MNRPLAWLLGLLLTACSPAGEQVRERSSWNDDWKFALSDSVQDYSSPDSDDSTWRILSLPHDWSIEGDFSLDNPSTPGGGALPGGIGWKNEFPVCQRSYLSDLGIVYPRIYRRPDPLVPTLG